MSAPATTLIEIEARVLGVLIEKSMTTPDQYPLSLNATTNGANQKSNRDPVTTYLEGEVAVALEGLIQKHLAGRVLGAGSRVEKFRHTATETLGLSSPKLAVLAELMMRGPQSPGELRARVHRMAPTPSLGDLMPLVDDLIGRELVERIPPAPGSRSERYVQLIAPDLHPVESRTASAPASIPRPPPAATQNGGVALQGRVDALEAEVAELRQKVDELIGQLGG